MFDNQASVIPSSFQLVVLRDMPVLQAMEEVAFSSSTLFECCDTRLGHSQRTSMFTSRVANIQVGKSWSSSRTWRTTVFIRCTTWHCHFTDSDADISSTHATRISSACKYKVRANPKTAWQICSYGSKNRLLFAPVRPNFWT